MRKQYKSSRRCGRRKRPRSTASSTRLNKAYCNPKPIQKPYPPIMIGGSGEKLTLKIVAKYADACNIFGSVETVKKKLEVLKEHCRKVGRDYDSITKSKLGHLIIDKDKDKVTQTINRFPEERRRALLGGAGLMYGTPEEVRRQVDAYRDAGIELLIVNLEPRMELQTLDLFASEVVKKL